MTISDFVLNHLEAFIILGVLGSFFGIPILYGYTTGNFPKWESSEELQPCLSSRTAQHVWLNENNEITYREPRQVCDLTYYKNVDYYRYSYEATLKYNKTQFAFYPRCSIDFPKPIFDSSTFNFVCPDGMIAQEVRLD